MAKSKSRTRKQPVYSKTKSPVKPTWMRVTKVIAIIVVSIVMLLAAAAAIIRYYRLVTNK